MEHNNKLFFLFQATMSFWFLSFAFMSLIWIWALLVRHEPTGRKGPGINLKEF
jgi:hypothetical protein